MHHNFNISGIRLCLLINQNHISFNLETLICYVPRKYVIGWKAENSLIDNGRTYKKNK
jgi:hypothetical protein